MNGTRPCLVFINSHPIQYFVPLYQYIAKEGSFDLTVLYCTDHGVRETTDKEFGTKVKWDVPMLSGYKYAFIKNYSPRPSIYSFTGLFNPGIIKQLYLQPKSIVVIHGWRYLSVIIAMMAARLFGHRVCLRAETPFMHEEKSGKTTSFARKLFLKYLLFPWYHVFLYIGKQNRLLYKFYGIADEKLVFTPYAVDNARFRLQHKEYKSDRTDIRNELGIPSYHKVILFSGKYIDKKRPLDLLHAYALLNTVNTTLVMMGEGILRKEMESFIQQQGLSNVLLTGFVNQGEVAKYYTAADIFVMCSGLGETWGLSVNEAMNFGLPLTVSDLTGCADDLIQENVNGFVFETGQPGQLASCLTKMLNNEAWLSTAGQQSLNIVDHYSFSTIVKGLKTIVAAT